MPNRRNNFYMAERTLNPDRFLELFHILHGSIFRGNFSATSRALGITRVTAIKYATEAPKQWWWEDVLINVIKTAYAEMVQSGSKRTRGLAKRAINDLTRILPREAEYMEFNAANQSNARRHLLSLFREYDQISTRQLRKPAFSGGYSYSSLRRAADDLELDKETTGFGDEKVTYYRLPESD